MALAALIVATTEDEGSAAAQPLLLTLGGQTLMERLVWQACRIGCRHIVLCAGPLPAAMIPALDRLRARGVDIKLARSPQEAADYFHPEEKVLVFANAVVVPDTELEQLVAREGPAALTLPEAWGRDRFERIDAVDNWAGVVTLGAPMIRDTASMLGEWAFAPTLIRRAIQHGVERRPLPLTREEEADELSPLMRDDLVGTARSLARAAEVVAEGALERRVILPALRPLASWIALKPVSATALSLGATMFLLGAVGLGVAGYASISLITLLPAYILAVLTLLVGKSGMPAPKPLDQFLANRPLWLPLIVLVVIGHMFWADGRGNVLPTIVLGLWFTVQSLLLFHARLRSAAWPEWRPGDAAIAPILALAFALGAPQIGLAVAIALTLILQISVQNRALWR